ncbi:hypothetical protein GC167_03415 [bacterium]|nr:hypothetical protein [bacterium]
MSQILYIVSDRRTGSTLLENLLGQLEGFGSVGELRMLQGHLKHEGPGEKWGWKCSCAQEVRACAVWGVVHQTIQLDELRTRLDHRESGPALFEPVAKAVDAAIAKLSIAGMEVAQDSLRILDEFGRVSGARVLVDSSKDALQGYFLYKARPDSVRVVHLKRSIPEIAYSKIGHRKGGVGSSLQMFQYLTSVALQNRFADAVVDRIPEAAKFALHYRDLATETASTLQALLDFLGQKAPATGLPTHMEPLSSHSIGGTPSRFERRPIVYDDKSKPYFDSHPLLSAYARWLEKNVKV